MGMNTWNQNAAHSKNIRETNECSSDKDYIPAAKTTSMSSLILWNISKALQLKPKMDLKAAIRKAQERLDNESRDLNAVLAQQPEQQHIVCALLAWQQLGKTGADSLYKFVEAKRSEARKCGGGCKPKVASPKKSQEPVKCGSFGSHTSGPIVRLPVETKVVMRMETSQPIACGKQCRTKGDCDTMRKLEAACCMESACAEQLAALDETITELRTRAAKLARREAERVELLERAEAAWKDLELGYERRLTVAQEKEDDITKQIEHIISDRNEYKNVCSTLTKTRNDRGDTINRLKITLNDIEKQIIDRACIKMKLNEECTKGEALLAEQQCKISQFERDVQFKEEHARRKLATLINDTDSARALTYETERAMRAELSGLREQIGQISNELLGEDEGNVRLKKELEEMRKEKADIVEDLEGCKQECDSKMQWQIDKIKEKKEALQAAKDRFLECQCKVPIDENVEVKRTPSLAALCRCAPEDRLLESAECSCTSLRSRLLSNLLADLFGGLQTELSGSGAHMPCHLLKCLEDKHNWDKASAVKTNLRNFFSNLLVGELDIAIATAIEQYHATWVGTSCADAPKMKPDLDDDLSEGWQQRALEKKAKKMATQIAENLFQERAEELAERAKAIAISTGPPPCQCKPIPSAPQPSQMFPLLLKPNAPFGGSNSTKAASRQNAKQHGGQHGKQYGGHTVGQSAGHHSGQPVEQPSGQSSGQPSGERHGRLGGQFAGQPCGQSSEQPCEPPAYWKRTIQDVTQLKMQIEDLKKEAIKKEDLKQILDDKFAKIVKETSGTENEKVVKACNDTANTSGETSKKETKGSKISKKDEIVHTTNHNKAGVTKRKPLDSNVLIKRTPLTESYKKYNRRATHPQSYAVNVCLCAPQRKSNCNKDGKSTVKQKLSKDILIKNSSFKNTKPINPTSNPEANENDKPSTHTSCNANYKCFHKNPSNKSIDKLLGTLVKWKCDLADPFGKGEKCLNISLSKCSKVGKSTLYIDSLNDSKVNLSHSTASQKGQANETDIIRATHKRMDSDSKPIKQPFITESVYLGAVNLDKSNEDFCKCNKNTKSPKKSNQMSRKNDNKNMTFQCINNNTSNACNCKIHQDMIKDNKVSQTDELKKGEIANQFEGVHTNNAKEGIEFKKIAQSKSNTHLNQQSGLGSDPNNPTYKTGSLSNNCDYYIKFLGVTLADLGSAKEKDKFRNHRAEDFVSRDTYSDRRKRPQKKLPSIESDNAFRNPKIKSLSSSNHFNSTEKTAKCVCHAQFDELKSFMTDVFSKQLINKNITRNDSGPHLVNVKGDEKLMESCVCCNTCKVDNSKELELNAFHLLEDHLKNKLEEFKSFSCKSSCIPPEEEEKLFSAILKRVKQVISDCANKMHCECSRSLTKDSSWNRAYGLLQEYLKHKIKRVQCTCISIDKKDIVLPEILEKVCNLIENDFQRLKEICKCKNEIRKKNVHIENVAELSAKDVPERDTNICKDESLNCAVVKLSKQNSNKSMILTDNTSIQVPPNLGMDNKSCEVVGHKNAQTTETDAIITENKCNGIMYNSSGSYDDNHNGISDLTTKFGMKEVMVNHYTVKETDTMCDLKEKGNDISLMTDESDDNLWKHEQTNNEQADDMSCIGFTVECSCERSLGPCFCSKSVIQSNNDKISSIWNDVLENYKNGKQDFPYIMQGVQNRNNDITKNCQPIPRILLSDIPEVPVLTNLITCSKGVSITSNADEVVLKDSNNINMNIVQNTTNTYEENGSLGTSFSNSETSPLDWFECPVSEEQTSPIKFNSHIYLTSPEDEYKKTFSDTGTIATTRSFQTCDCERVPLCHVKMLVENIEQNLSQSKCTCDSLISRVCPVHSKIS